MTLRLRLAALFGALLLVLSGLFVISLQGQLGRELPAAGEHDARGTPSETLQAALHKLTAVWLVAGIPVMGLCFLLGLLLASRSVRHLRAINDQLSALQPETLGNRIVAPENDPEVAELVRQINALLGRVGRSYDELSEFSARVAHELRTPLTLLRMQVEERAAQLPPDFSEQMQEEIRRLSRLVERSLATARAQGGRLPVNIAAVDLSALLDDLREDYATLAETRNTALTWDVPAGLSVSADKDLLNQILQNLLDNAVRHGSGGVDVRAGRREAGDLVTLEIRNEADGRPKATDGAGIGLRLVKALVGTMPGMEVSAARQDGHYNTLLVCPVHAAAQGVSPVRVGKAGSTLWISVHGRGTFQNSPAVAAFVAEKLKPGGQSLAVDLSECTNADSTFLGTLAACGSRLRRSGGELFFSGADRHMRSLLADYGLQTLASKNTTPAAPAWPDLRDLPLDTSFEAKRRTMIEAHEALAALTPENAERFRDALEFLKHRVPED
jgi:signal transduction histidine kinase/anti-anti-sigma regulatory factor